MYTREEEEKMTDYEIASLAAQQASVAAQQASVAAQQASVAAQQAGNEIALWAAYVQAGTALVVGLLQAGIIGWGIRVMTRESAKREQQHADRHTETMEVLRQQGEALRTLIERTAPRD